MSRQRAIQDQALEWLIRKDEPGWTDSEQSELDAWLEESMAHKAAFWRAEHGWRKADRIRSLGAQETDARALTPSRRWWAVPMAASLAAMLGIGGYSLVPKFIGQRQTQRARFDTPVGGHRIVSLADGSTVELNTQSVVRAAIDGKKRDVWLDSGEAYFEVKHREGEPFAVHAGTRTITVLGTKFSVWRDKDRIRVNVIEGRVRVDDGRGRDTSAAIITAGGTAIARAGSTLITPKSEERVEDALAWRHGMLTFDLIPLGEVAAEFNRYNRLQLTVDTSAAAIPIGGTFQASNVDAFARLLHDAYGLKTEQVGNQIRISN